ncbi:MAG: Holliday junction branch migration protein RuvA [Lachnospiraceae bacterium]|nr:Holliday junction branch migration protein RuvA [Lachnospiraceae bacterium]
MISYIKGTVEDIYEDRIVVECNNIGYNIFTSASMKVNAGDSVKIYTYLNVREDAMLLYGFLSKDELRIFKLILGVSGIGPKGALNILSSISVEELQMAVMSNDSKRISKAQGIGPKTAQKLILELKDKLKPEDVFSSEVSANAIQTSSDNKSEALEALTVLGYSPTESLKAVNGALSILGTDADTEQILKAALKQIM